MKKYIFLGLFIGFVVWLHYYSVEQCEVQDFRICIISTSNRFDREKISKLRFEDSIKNKNKIDSLERELIENEENLSNAHEQLHFYNSLKNKITMDLILLLIGASSLVYWYSHRNDAPNHPKLFWTLLFGWLYILYYVCEKKNL